MQFSDVQSDGAGAPLALALTESLIHALGAFPGVRVIGPAVSERGIGSLVDARAAARVLDAQYVLSGAIRTTPDLLRVMIRLSDGETGELLWSDVCDQERTQVTGFHDEDDLVRRIAATIGDFRGVVLRDTTARRAGTRHPAAYAATHPEDLWGPLIRCLAFIGLGHDDQARQELDAALAIEPGLLSDDARVVVEQLQDAPPDIRVTIREQLLEWLASQPGQGRPQAGG